MSALDPKPVFICVPTDTLGSEKHDADISEFDRSGLPHVLAVFFEIQESEVRRVLSARDFMWLFRAGTERADEVLLIDKVVWEALDALAPQRQPRDGLVQPFVLIYATAGEAEP